jgi:hypothetical protein
MIEAGIKKEEYREIKPFWIKRLIWFHEEMEVGVFEEFCTDLIFAANNSENKRFSNCDDVLDYFNTEVAFFNDVHFARGGHFHPSLAQMTLKGKGIRIGEGREEWGAEPGKKYFVIELGEVITNPLT